MPDSFQAQFHRRWRHLQDPHVRALAWLLDAPDMLEPSAARWQGRIATLPATAGDDAAAWLTGLDQAPAALHAWLDVQPFSRLGRYAEKLMSFYFQHQGVLAAHGVQVQSDKNETVGEFDFLLWQGELLLHWEFATKFYLLQSDASDLPDAEYFVGPNLADTLGAKMDKILNRQLALAQHPAAQSVLPQPVAAAQALIKGWLFYHRDDLPAHSSGLGLTAGHCRGFWCTRSEFDVRRMADGICFAVMPRLSWLAPARLACAHGLDRAALSQTMAAHFAGDSMPLLVAMLEADGDDLVETERGFIVPDDWQSRAGERISKGRAAPVSSAT
jgi:hypothetical protein